MEEDKEILKRFIESLDFQEVDKEGLEIKHAIENVLTRLKDYEQIEKEHQKENGELRARIQELEELEKKDIVANFILTRFNEISPNDLSKLSVENLEIRQEEGLLKLKPSEFFIDKEKIEKKIRELDERIKNPEKTSYWASYTISECILIIRILEDLLEENK